MDPLIEDPGATNAADVPPANLPESGRSDDATEGPDDSSDGAVSRATSTDGGNPAVFSVLDTRDAADTVTTSVADAGSDAGEPKSDVDAGVDAGESASTPDEVADGDASSSTGAP